MTRSSPGNSTLTSRAMRSQGVRSGPIASGAAVSDDLHGTQGSSHTTPASSSCTQLWLPQPLLLQLAMLSSSPLHSTLSSRMAAAPQPAPNHACVRAVPPASPSWLQMTFAAASSQ